MTLLVPVGDGLTSGAPYIVGNAQDRATVLAILGEDGGYVTLSAVQGALLDQRISLSGPMALGDAVLRVRLARTAGAGGVEVSIGVWGENPRSAKDLGKLVAAPKNFQVWTSEWLEYAFQLKGRAVDIAAQNMTDLWMRLTIITALGGGGAGATLGISSVWLEVPTTDSGSFNQLANANPPAGIFLSAVFESNRVGIARRIDGEWFDSLGAPFEAHTSALPLGSDGLPQPSRAVKGWR